ncbi:MAG: DNA polymerase I, partial [Planctomycetota bacterium]
LDEVLMNAEKAPGKKLAENLVQFADQARLSRELVRLRTDLPLILDFETARIHDPDAESLYRLFNLLGFRRYAADMRNKLTAIPDTTSNSVPAAEPETGLFARSAKLKAGGIPSAPVDSAMTETVPASPAGSSILDELPPAERIRTVVALQASLSEFHSAAQLFLEYSTVGSGVRQKRLALVAITNGLRAILIDVTHGTAAAELHNLILRFVSSYAGELVVSTAKSLCHLLLSAGESLPQHLFDISIADYLLEAGARSHELSEIVDRHATESVRKAAISEVRKSRQKTMFDDDEATPAEGDSPASPELSGHCERQMRLLVAVARKLRDGLSEDHLIELYKNVESPLIKVLARMEFAGIRVDVDELKRQSKVVTEHVDRLTEEIHKIAGRRFNIDSPKQLQTILFTDLKLPILRRTSTGASTDQEVLEELALQHPLPAKIMERRHLIKLKGTYLDALPELVHPQTGRIHALFHQTVAATGRLSSSDPNLQNIPIRTPEGQRVRRAFCAGLPDWTLICADYSQIELRVLAHFSGDEALTDAFRRGVDIHAAVASQVFGVPIDAVTSDLRRIAKAVNFGVIYGQTPWGLAAALGIGKDEAAQFIDDYFRKYSGVAKFCENVLTETARTGFARTILNRRRAISGIRKTTGITRSMPERTAINTVIQGSAADLIKRAMLDVDAALAKDKLRATMLLQIHDELVFECHRDDANALIPLIRQQMQNAMQLTVPLVVDVTCGQNWLDQQDVPPVVPG